MGLILNPEVKIKPDGGRAVLFSVNSADRVGESVFRLLHPKQAIMLSLFDGQRTIPEIKKTVAYLFNLTSDEASKRVEILLELPVNKSEKIRNLLIEFSDARPNMIRSYDSRNFIVSVEEIEMWDTRCKLPCSILVLPTMRCATNCIYCYADRLRGQGRKEFDLALFKRLLKEAKECGIETIEFSGGDIFSREDAFNLIESTLSEGMYPSVPTKYPLSKEQVKRLAQMGLRTIQISIDAFSPEIIDKMVGRSGYGEKILKTLDYLGEANIQVRTNSVLTPYNIKDAVQLLRHLAGLPHVFKSNFSPYSRSMYQHEDGLFCSAADIQEFERAFKTIKEEFPGKPIFFSGATPDPYISDEAERTKNFEQRALCTANRRGLVVLPDGQVTVCEELYFHEGFIIGDLNEQNLMEAWNSPRALALASPNQASCRDGACADCSDFIICNNRLGRCFRDVIKAYGFDRPHWPDPRCPRAPVGNRLS